MLKTMRPRRAWQETHVNRKGFSPSGIRLGSTSPSRTPSAGCRHEPAVETEKPALSLPFCRQPVENRTECEGDEIASRRQTRGVQEGEVGKQGTPSFCLEGCSGPWGAASAPPAPPLTRDYSSTAPEGAGAFRPAGSLLRVRVTSPAAAPSHPPPGLSPPYWPPRSCSCLCLSSAPLLLPAVGSRAGPRGPGFKRHPRADGPVHVLAAGPSPELQRGETNVR